MAPLHLTRDKSNRFTPYGREMSAGRHGSDVLRPLTSAQMTADLARTVSLAPHGEALGSFKVNRTQPGHHIPEAPHDPNQTRDSSALETQSTANIVTTNTTGIKQTGIPVEYETFTTHANIPSGLERARFPLDVSAFAFRASVMRGMGLSSSDVRKLAWTLVGAKSDPKPFATLADVEDALEAVLACAKRARTREKGLKIVNQDPVRKSAAVTSLVERTRREEKDDKKKAQSKAQVESMQHEQEFVQILHDYWGPCAKHPRGKAGCYICPRTAQHMPLTHQASFLWAVEHEQDPGTVTVERPPNCLEFDPAYYATDSRRRSTRLEAKVKSELDIKLPPKDETDVAAKGDSPTSPICIDLDDGSEDLVRVKSRSGTPPIKVESPVYIEIDSDSEYVDLGSISAASTRFPSPCELLSPHIALVFPKLQVKYPSLSILPFVSRLRAFGIRQTFELAGRSIEWLVTTVGMPIEEATVVWMAVHDHGTQAEAYSVAGPSRI